MSPSFADHHDDRLQDHDRRILEQFTRQAEPFAQVPAHSDAEPVALLRDALALRPDDVVLDVACGPGIVACGLAPHCSRVEGMDVVPAMIEQARKRQAEAGLRNLAWRTGHAEALPYDNASFSVVVTRYSFHHLQEPRLVLAEMSRVCQRGGRIAVADVTPEPDKRDAYDVLELLRDPSHVKAWTLKELTAMAEGLPLRLEHVSGYSLDIDVEDQLRASFPPEGNADRIRSMIEADIDIDRLSIRAYRAGDAVRYRIPVSLLVWSQSL